MKTQRVIVQFSLITGGIALITLSFSKPFGLLNLTLLVGMLMMAIGGGLLLRDHASLKTLQTLCIVGMMSGCLLIFSSESGVLLHSLMVNSAGQYRIAGRALSVAFILLRICWFFSDAWIYGVPLLLSSGMGFMYCAVHTQARLVRFKTSPIGFMGLSGALFGNTLVGIVTMPFFFVPAGTHVWGVGWLRLFIFVSTATLICSFVLGGMTIIKEKTYHIGSIIILLGFTPFIVGALLVNIAAWVKGFSFE